MNEGGTGPGLEYNRKGRARRGGNRGSDGLPNACVTALISLALGFYAKKMYHMLFTLALWPPL